MGVRVSREKIRKEIRIIILSIVLFIFVIGIYAVYNYENTEEYMTSSLENYGLISLFIIVFVLEFLPQVISPDYSLLLSIGLGMNVYHAVLITMIASIIGSTFAFLVGYHYGFDTIAPFFKKETINKTLKFWEKHSRWFVLASGTIPLPIPYVPLIFGALRMKKIDFVVWGIIPRALGFILTGIVGHYGMVYVFSFL
jgi:membrane protein YqaA with SNARE-associated domain